MLNVPFMPAYGVFSNAGQGHVVTSILIAMIAMVFTAMSYGRMARVYPSAGSAYTYVGRTIHPSLGYVTGWSMTMDYILNPLICTIWCSKAMADLLAGTRYQIPYPGLLWPVIFALLFTGLNLRGVKTSARINQTLCAIMGAVILAFFWYTIRYIFHLPQYPEAYFLRPFYNPQTFTINGVFHGTSVAVLTYIGFDGISTLSEEVENPKRNIFLATVLVCVVTGFLAAAEVYGAQLLSSQYVFSAAEVENAFSHVAAIAGGTLMTKAISITLLIATVGSGMGSQLGAARLLYGMGRSDAIPEEILWSDSPPDTDSGQQCDLRWSDCLVGSFPHQLRQWCAVAQLRCADRFHGRQPGGAHPLLHSRRRPHSWSAHPTGAGIPDLSFHLDSPVEPGVDRRNDMDGGGDRVRRMEDPGFPEQSGEFRRASGRLSNSVF